MSDSYKIIYGEDYMKIKVNFIKKEADIFLNFPAKLIRDRSKKPIIRPRKPIIEPKKPIIRPKIIEPKIIEPKIIVDSLDNCIDEIESELDSKVDKLLSEKLRGLQEASKIRKSYSYLINHKMGSKIELKELKKVNYPKLPNEEKGKGYRWRHVRYVEIVRDIELMELNDITDRYDAALLGKTLIHKGLCMKIGDGEKIKIEKPENPKWLDKYEKFFRGEKDHLLKYDGTKVTDHKENLRSLKYVCKKNIHLFFCYKSLLCYLEEKKKIRFPGIINAINIKYRSAFKPWQSVEQIKNEIEVNRYPQVYADIFRKSESYRFPESRGSFYDKKMRKRKYFARKFIKAYLKRHKEASPIDKPREQHEFERFLSVVLPYSFTNSLPEDLAEESEHRVSYINKTKSYKVIYITTGSYYDAVNKGETYRLKKFIIKD